MTIETDRLPPGVLAAAAILERIDDGVCALDRELTVTYANAAIGRLFGSEAAGLLGRPIRELLATSANDELYVALDDALRDGGSRTIAWAQGTTEIGIDATPDGIWLRFRAATARRAMEQQLRERDEILTMAEHSAGIGVWDVDLATGMLRGTPQFWRVMGLPEVDHPVSIETTRRLRLPDDRDRVAHGFQNVVSNHANSFEMEYRIRRPSDGEIRWIFGRGQLVRDLNGRPLRYRGIDIDVTERKAAEAVLADLNAALEQRVRERTAALEAETARRAEAEAQLHQAQKMQTIGQLTGGIAHDFNNLLTVISGNVETLERRLSSGDPQLRRYAEAALRGTERAATLTQRLLAFARRAVLEPKVVDVNRLILGMADLLHRTLGESISVRMALAPELPAVLVDPNQLENAILNLAVNSRDAMPDGGTLEIATVSADARDAEPEAGGGGARYVQISVRDSGQGMSAQVRDRAFEPFFTTKEAGEGTGLGLPQVYGFIKQSGGTCKLDSVPGAGTTVSLYLPSTQNTDVAVAPADRRPALTQGSGETILVTEDDADVRAFTMELLSELGYSVLGAADATAALQILENEPAIELLFTDLGPPGPLNGRQLAETAITRRPKLKVLLTTGYANDAILRRGWLDPGMELIVKPFASAALAAKIRQILAS